MLSGTRLIGSVTGRLSPARMTGTYLGSHSARHPLEERRARAFNSKQIVALPVHVSREVLGSFLTFRGAGLRHSVTLWRITIKHKPVGHFVASCSSLASQRLAASRPDGRPAFSYPRQRVLDAHGFPLAAPRRQDAPLVERVGDCPQGGRPGRLNLGDDRQHVRRAPVSIGPEDRCANLTGGGQVRIAELLAPGLSGAQRGFGSLGDEGPLLLSERGKQMQHKRIRVGAEFRDDERDAKRWLRRDEEAADRSGRISPWRDWLSLFIVREWVSPKRNSSRSR